MPASMNYHNDKYTDKSPLVYYVDWIEAYVIHKESRETLEQLLNMLAEDGEEKTLEYIKRELNKYN